VDLVLFDEFDVVDDDLNGGINYTMTHSNKAVYIIERKPFYIHYSIHFLLVQMMPLGNLLHLKLIHHLPARYLISELVFYYWWQRQAIPLI